MWILLGGDEVILPDINPAYAKIVEMVRAKHACFALRQSKIILAKRRYPLAGEIHSVPSIMEFA